MNTSDFKSFYYLESGEITFSQLDTIKTEKKLDSGCYNISFIGYPENRVKIEMNRDTETTKIHHFPDRNKLDELFGSFFNKTVRSKVSTLGFYHKTGVLLYGKEGTGKSTILKHYFTKAIQEHSAIVFNMLCIHEVKPCWEFIQKCRAVQDNPFIILFEEFDVQIENRNESFLKTILDGNMSIDNCIFLATTNYIDKIPDAMKRRPSRFKYVIEIEGIQSYQEVYALIRSMIGDVVNDADIKTYAKDLLGQTLDTIKQFCVDEIMDLKTYKKEPRTLIGFLNRNFSDRQ